MVISGVAAMGTSLLADIGGSKSRFALAHSAGAPKRVLVIENDTGADLAAAGGGRPRGAGGRALPRGDRRAPARGDARCCRPSRGRGDRAHQSTGLAVAAARICQAVRIFAASRAE